MQYLKSFFRRIHKDLQMKQLVPLKILFFVHASTLCVLYPYLTIHMRELGINVEETAFMSALTPAVAMVMPPLAGMVADKIGNFKLLLAVASTLGGGAALLLLAVPVGRITVTFPSDSELLADCNQGNLRLRPVEDFPCNLIHPYPYDVNITMHTCGFVCNAPHKIVAADIRSYHVSLLSPGPEPKVIYRNTITNVVPSQHNMKDQSTTRILHNNPFYNTTVKMISDRFIFFPTPNSYSMQCDQATKRCMFDKVWQDIDDKEVPEGSQYVMRLEHDQKNNADVNTFAVESFSHLNNGSVLPTIDSEDDQKTDESSFQSKNAICTNGFTEKNEIGDIVVKTGDIVLSDCSTACVLTTPRKGLCENLQQRIEIDPAFTFWTYLAVRVSISIIGGTAFAMFEGAVIAILREQQGDYGLQRVYGSIGGMISSPLSGMLIDYASRGKGYTDFRPAFYLYAILKVASGALMMCIDLEFKQPAQNLMTDVITVLKNVELVALFIACFIMGTAWGYIESFLFWLLQDLGASRSLMGITITVGGIAGLPLLVLSGPIIRRLGHANVLFIGFIFYAIRLLGYSLIYNPWLCLIFEALESVTSSLSFTAAVTYAAKLSSTTTDTSVQGLLGGIYYGVGKGAGSLIGGYLMKGLGTRPTYQIFSATTCFAGCGYFLFNKFYLGKRPQVEGNDICKKKPKPDLESQGIKEKECVVAIKYIDGAENKSSDLLISNGEKIALECGAKLGSSTTDGSSDSGVDNPAYTETEVEEADGTTTTGNKHVECKKENADNS